MSGNTAPSKQTDPTPEAKEDALPPVFDQSERMERELWRNWQLLVLLILVSTLGFAVDFVPRGENTAWVGATTGVRLLIVISALGMTALLTRQQRQAIEMRRQLRQSLVEASERVRNNMDRVKSMLDVTRTLSKEIDSQAVFDRITETCLDTFHCDQVSLMILNHDSGDLEVRSAKGHVNPERVIGRTVRIGQGIAGWVAKNRKPVRLGDSLQIESKLGIQGKQASLNAAMVVPILVRDELVGVLNVSSRSNTITYDDEDLGALAVFAEQAGVTCRHTEQALWMRETITLLENELDHLKRRQAA